MANPEEHVVHLRWYRECFDPSAPLVASDYITPATGEGSSDAIAFTIPNHPALGTSEHPPFLTLPDLLETMDSAIVNDNYDAVQWYYITKEARRRRVAWMALGRAISFAVVACRVLDTVNPADQAPPAVVDTATSQQRPRQRSRNTLSETSQSQTSRQNSVNTGMPVQAIKRSLSNSRRSGSAGSASSGTTSARNKSVGQVSLDIPAKRSVLLSVTSLGANQVKRI
eukprot:GDKJ01006662.1.p1 GENE.GDKJ01006662.1~~GDKJ01006662.1.p1  ORF type:complete len:257 (+),score=-18.64 GDKJ01006662.1:95-772(+)